ncbi:MAG: carboxypeptidase-like regulatory domain-containing protein [Myxococcota bacterium]|nr:carboxypeptidase-like regulatory domain-containing protein [Myxococcota bacterium]
MKYLSLWILIPFAALSLTACDDDPDDPKPADTSETADGTDQTGCCPNAPANEYHISITGMAIDLSTNQGVAVALAPISPMDALTAPTPTHITEVDAGADGSFSIDCFDVSGVALGMVVLADDAGFDGAAGTYFPTSTGVKAWASDAEKVCVEGATVFAVPNTMVAGLDQLPDLDSVNDGFAMGLVLDASNQPVAGATLKLADGSPLSKVYYPKADFSAFDGTSTDVTGLFVLPQSNFAAGLQVITAEKDGMVFETSQASVKPGYCYFFMVSAE